MNRALRPLRLRAEWGIVALFATLLALLLVYDRTTARLDRLAYDLMLRIDESAPDPRIALVTIDDASLAEFGAWPWPRDLQAKLIAAVARARPAGAAYDVLLLEPSQPAADAALASAVSASPLFLPLLIDSPGRNGAPFDIRLPIPEVRSKAAGLGHVSLIADPDGMFRRIRLVDGTQRTPIPHLMLALARTADVDLPKHADQPKLLPFVGPSGSFPAVGASAILRGQVPPELLADRLLIVGATAAGLGDRHPTARGDGEGVMTGLEIQANLLDALLRGRMISEASLALRILATVLPLWTLLLGFLVVPTRRISWVMAGAGLLALATSATLLLHMRIWVSPVPALFMLVFLYPLWAWRRLAAVSAHMLRQLEQLRQEPAALSSRRSAPRGADPINRQLILLDNAIGDMRDMRRFVGESLHQIPDAIFILSLQGQLLLANGLGEALLHGIGATEPRTQIARLLDAVEPIQEETGTALSRDQLPYPPNILPWQGWLRAVDGRVFEAVMTPRHDGQEQSIGWILRLRDVTEVWRARQEREELMEFLSHDMRTPQASILAILDDAAPQQIARSVAERIQACADRTLKLADDFVQLARAQRLTYRTDLLDLSDVVAVVSDEIWPRLAAKDIELVLEGDDREWLVNGERSLLTRALLNLFDNAAKFSPAGGVVRCRILEQDDRREVSVAISDDGPGIAADQICTLFERYRTRGGSDGAGKGAGLGLAFVDIVVGRHGGSVSCASPPGLGATFEVTLPLAS